jgi:RimJ/RimL family protein N-acetyltransferase
MNKSRKYQRKIYFIREVDTYPASEDHYRFTLFLMGLSDNTNKLWTHQYDDNPEVRRYNIFHQEGVKLIAQHEGTREIIAFGNLVEHPEYPYPSLGIVVADAYRNEGIGNAMMSMLMLYGNVKKGYPGIYLTVMKHNTIAFHMYEKLGFQIVGTLCCDGIESWEMRYTYE